MMLFRIHPYLSESVLTCGQIVCFYCLVRGLGFVRYAAAGVIQAPMVHSSIPQVLPVQTSVSALLLTLRPNRAMLFGFIFFANAQLLLRVWPNLFLIATDVIARSVVLTVSVLELFSLLTFLRYSARILLDLVVDLVVYDRPDCFLRFFVVYVLRSTVHNSLWLVRTQISEIMPLVTTSTLYFGFSWLEREVFDMYGIFFINHPDLRKILNNYCFSGFPLRRDFPLTGSLVGCIMGAVRGAVEIVYSLKMC